MRFLKRVEQFRRRWKENIRLFHNLSDLCGELWSVGRTACLGAIVTRLISAVTPLIQMWIAKQIVDFFVQVKALGRGDASHFLWILIGAECALILFNDCASRAGTYCETALAERFSTAINLRLLRHAENLDLEIFERPAMHDCMERARNHASSQFGTVVNLIQLAQVSISLALLLAGVVILAPSLVLIQTVMVLPVVVAEVHFAGVWHRLFRGQTQARRQMAYFMTLGTDPASAKEVILLGLAPFIRNRFDALTKHFRRDNDQLAWRRAKIGGLLGMFGTFAYYIAYAYLAIEALRGKLSVGDLVFLSAAFQKMKANLQSLVSSVSIGISQAMCLSDIFELFEIEARVVSPRHNPVPAPRAIQDGIEFDRVSFCYAGSLCPVLRDISLRIEGQQHVALVGKNGAGKSTIVKLLCRLYDPTEGRILLDGVDLRDYDLAGLRRQISTVLQDFVRYEMSAAANIGLGDIADHQNRLRIARAAKKGLATQVIQDLPKGYDQMLGRHFAEGMELSGGQWQRMAFARCCMREAQVVILDEPTASLDASAEYEICRHFKGIADGRIAIFISHRLSSARLADRIFVLENGRLVEQGSHHELVRQSGRYEELFELQAAGYR